MTSLLNNSIVIIDYEMGNLRSVQKAFEKIGCDAIISNNHEVIKRADKLVLPGVGSFKDGMINLKKLELIELLGKEVLTKRKPFLGICLGMQLLAKAGYENGQTVGLNWIDAEVNKFDFSACEQKLKVPHIGWNNVSYQNENKLFEGVLNNSDFYFVHSYHFQTNEDIVTSFSDYGRDFISSIRKENIFAFQFHPEKSQLVGLKIIDNFVKIELNNVKK